MTFLSYMTACSEQKRRLKRRSIRLSAAAGAILLRN